MKRFLGIWTGALALLLGLVAEAELTASDRRNAIGLLCPNDPLFLAVEDLPEVELLEPEALRQRVRNMERGNLPYDRRKKPWLQLAVQSLLAREYETLLRCLENADRKDEFRERPLPLAAFAYGELGRWEESLAAWQSILSRRNEKNPVRVNIALCQMRLLRFRAAAETLDLIERSQDTEGDIEAMQGILQHARSVHAFALGDVHGAWLGFVKAVEYPDRPVSTYIGLCLLSQQEGTQEDAVGWLRKAMRHATAHERLLFLRHPQIRRLEKHPLYRETLAAFDLEKYVLLPPGRELHAEESPTIVRYHALHAIPESMRIHLKLRLFEPQNRSL